MWRIERYKNFLFAIDPSPNSSGPATGRPSWQGARKNQQDGPCAMPCAPQLVVSLQYP